MREIAIGSDFMLSLLEEDFLISGFAFNLLLKMKPQVFNPPICKTLLLTSISHMILVS
jgi:hypothetical protein